MSTSAVFEFIQRSETDDALRARLAQTHGAQATVGLGTDLGYAFTAEELGRATSLLTFLGDLWVYNELRDAVTEAGGDAAVVRVAARHGYSFTGEDLAHVTLEASGELGEQELGAVAGGSGAVQESVSGLRVQLDTSLTRQTLKTDFGTVLAGTADASGTTAPVAAPFIPGGAVVSAAISGLGS